MSALDWILFVGFLAFTIWDGARRSRKTRSTEDYFLAGRSVPWWAMGVSIMATQASAITLIGTTGQGMEEGLRFVQFYFALPIAMLILCFTLVPLFHRQRVFTAYEYLGTRFDGKTRLVSATVFLALRSLSCGVVIYAPSVVLATLLKDTGISVSSTTTVVIMGIIAITYTALGGMRAVIATDVKQMTVMVIGLGVAFVILVARIPDDVSVRQAFLLAGEAGHLKTFDFRWDPYEKYTVWSGLFGGLFLFLAYFGADQSQVQRYLSGRSLRDKQGALLLNAVLKVPFQYFVLMCGVLLFVFYVFNARPVSFVPDEAHGTDLPPGARARHQELVLRFDEASRRIREAGRRLVHEAADGGVDPARAFRDALAERTDIREELHDLRERQEMATTPDVNYAFPHFILNFMPVGLVGLLLAAIFAAALSSIDSELNALATVTVMDLYRFGLDSEPDERKMLRVSRGATVVLGSFATAFALTASELGSVIEAVNRVGSYFYGSLLGVFILATAVPRANGHGACSGLLSGVAAVWIAKLVDDDVAFLYLNTIGTVTAVTVGVGVSWVTRAWGRRGRRSRRDNSSN